MNKRMFSLSYDEIIFTVFENLKISNAGNPGANARLINYPYDNLVYNVRKIREKLDESDLMKKIFYEDYKYMQEIHELFPFYCNNGFSLPEDFESRLDALIKDLNTFRLQTNQDLEYKYQGSYGFNYQQSLYVCNPLSDDEIQQFNKENIERLMEILAKNSKKTIRIRKLFGRFPHKFEDAYYHLETRAVKADNLMENILRLYERLYRVITRNNLPMIKH